MTDFLLDTAGVTYRPEIRPLVGGRPDHAERRVGSRPRRADDDQVTRAALATLEKLNRGVLLLDQGGHVQFMNRAARCILQRADGIKLRHGRLAFADSDATSALGRLLETRDTSLVLRVENLHAEGGAYRILVSPLHAVADGAGFCVFIYEPDPHQQPPPHKVLKDLYGLTPAETRLASTLFVTGSLQHAARELGVSLNTAKTTLKRVFSKCEVATQADLLRLLSLGPRTL